MEPRTCAERRRHAEDVFRREHGQVWIATARESTPHLIPMSYAAIGSRILLCTGTTSPTGRNLLSNPQIKAAFGTTDNVVLVTAHVGGAYPVADAPIEVQRQFSGQADWDPLTVAGEFTFFVLDPVRIDVWGPQSENAGREVMRDGQWVC